MKGNTSKRNHKPGRKSNGSGYLVKRGNTWTARWKVAGKIVSQSLHTSDRREAELELARLSAPRTGLRDRSAVRKLVRVMSAQLSDVTEQVRTASVPVTQLYELWQSSPLRGRGKGQTLDAYRVHVHKFVEWLGRRYPEITNARDVSRVVAEEYILHRAATRSPNTVVKSLNILAAVWRSLCVQYGLEFNPWAADRIARPKLQTFTRRPLTDAECDKLLEVADDTQRLRILLALDAGLRLGDVVTLKWPEIDFERRIIMRDTRKTGMKVIPPLSERLAAALAERLKGTKDKEGYIFPADVARLRNGEKTDKISDEMSALFTKAGIKTHETGPDGKKHLVASFHSLRHTFVSRLMERGVNPYYVQRAVGHSTMTMTAHYDHSAAEEIRKALDGKK